MSDEQDNSSAPEPGESDSPPDEPAGKADGKAEDTEGTPEQRMDLPKWNRARTKRKAPKGTEKDAFQDGVRSAGRTAVKRAPLLAGAVVLVLASIGGYLWIKNTRDEEAARATRLLAAASAYEARARVGDVAALMGESDRPPPIPIVQDEAERNERIDKSLGDLESEDPASEANVAGQLVRAARLLRSGEAEAAAAAYRKFIEQAGGGHPLGFLAQEGLAFALEAQGDLDGALAQLDALAGAPGGFYRDEALWHRGRILEVLGKSDEALEVYRQYIDEFPLTEPSLARTQVHGRLVELDPDIVPATLAQPGAPPGGGMFPGP